MSSDLSVQNTGNRVLDTDAKNPERAVAIRV